MSFCFRKDKPSHPQPSINLPFGDPSVIASQPKGCIIYNPKDGFVYISDGRCWDKVSGVNNPVDILLPISQHRVAKWSEEYPPGAGYNSPVLQDSSLELTPGGDGILHCAGNNNKLSSFPWTRGNFLAQGSISTSYCFGLSLDHEDSNNFVPILTQTRGCSYPRPEGNTGTDSGPSTPRISYDTGSIIIGHSAMENIVSTSNIPRSCKNTVIGVRAGKNMGIDACNNIYIGWRAANTGLEIDSSTNNIVIGSDTNIHPRSKNKIVIGEGASSVDDAPGTVCIGAQSSGCNANVVIGAFSNDGGNKNVISIGSGVTALGPNRLVLGSSISPTSAGKDGDPAGLVSTGQHLPVQIGGQLYYIPLLKNRD